MEVSTAYYRDLDVSVIDGLPPGRKTVKTGHMSEEKAYELVKSEIKNGRQAYIVYPLVEESPRVELRAATAMADHLRSELGSTHSK